MLNSTIFEWDYFQNIRRVVFFWKEYRMQMKKADFNKDRRAALFGTDTPPEKEDMPIALNLEKVLGPYLNAVNAPMSIGMKLVGFTTAAILMKIDADPKDYKRSEWYYDKDK